MKKSNLDNWIKRFSTGCLKKKAYKTADFAKLVVEESFKKKYHITLLLLF